MNPDNSAGELVEFKFSVIFKAWKSQINDVTINKKLKSCMKSNKVYTVSDVVRSCQPSFRGCRSNVTRVF